MTNAVYVGYDIREHAAWLVCRHSLTQQLWEDSIVHPVHPLAHRDLRRRGLFDRSWQVDEKGQFIDVRDGRPFSTEFSHSRFLVPRIAADDGYNDLAMFVDCDFMFYVPVEHLFKAIDRTKVVSCVKFRQPIAEGVKMDGMVQQAYNRKLWSSLMVFNMKHPDISKFIDLDVNHATGREMHGFLDLADDEIGEIDPRWNYIPGLSEPNNTPFAVHWSLGGPWLPEYLHAPHAQAWRERYHRCLAGNLWGTASQITLPLL